MKPTRLHLIASCMIAGLVLLSVGCSQMPTGPLADSDPQSASTNSDPQSASTRPVSLSGSATIDGDRGGVLTVGRWRVIVPNGAYNGKGTITLSIPDTSVPQCDVHITPASLNNFEKPVELQCRWTSQDDAKTRNMQWLDPATGKWVVIESWPDGSYRCAPLDHFSTYRSGKAGW